MKLTHVLFPRNTYYVDFNDHYLSLYTPCFLYSIDNITYQVKTINGLDIPFHYGLTFSTVENLYIVLDVKNHNIYKLL